MANIYSYRILGRSPGIAEAITYSGQVSAQTRKEELLAALVAEFGDEHANKPLLNRLCDDGWVDEDTVSEQFVTLDDDSRCVCFANGEQTFDVEATEN